MKQGLLIIAFFAVVFWCVSCEKETTTIPKDPVHSAMRGFYTESCGLNVATSDSVINYYCKFSKYYNLHPECEADEYYPPIVDNIGNAFTKYGIIQIGDIFVKTAWDGEKHISFLTNTNFMN